MPAQLSCCHQASRLSLELLPAMSMTPSCAVKDPETPAALLVRIGQDGRTAQFNPGLHQLLIEHSEQGLEKIDLGFSGSRLLERLLLVPGDVVSREDLIAYAWPERVVGQGSLNQQIYTLRQMLGDETARDVIQTLPRRGYLFNPSYLVTQPRTEPAAPAATIEPIIPTQARPLNKRWSVAGASIIALLAIAWLLNLNGSFKQTRQIKQIEIWVLETDPQLRQQILLHTEPLLTRMSELTSNATALAISQAVDFYHVHCMHGSSSRTLSFHTSQLEQLSEQQLSECLL